MVQPLESASKAISPGRLLVRGAALLIATGLLAAAAIAKSQGTFSDSVRVIAMLSNVGDGLPSGSDVKFRGALVGTVDTVTPALDGRANEISLRINPHFAKAIPATVTARVVPSNVFAVSSIQLVDNGPAAGLRPGSHIVQDESLATVQFQTALTKLREVLGAAGRPGSDDTVGVLAAVAEATRGRGDALSRAGAGANRIVNQLNTVMADDGTESSLHVLSSSLHGLQSTAPDLLEALHHAVVPMRTVAEKRQSLTNFLSAGQTTFGTMGEAFENNTDRLIVITTQLSPVVGVIADGGGEFAPMVTRINDVVNKFFSEVWRADRNSAAGKFLLVFTPNRMYTRQDCPRYGQMEGPSCQTAPLTADPPALPRTLDPRNYPVAPQLAGGVGGNVGSVGSPEELAQLSEILGPGTNPASELLLGPIARGDTVQVFSDPDAPTQPAPPPGAPLPAEATAPNPGPAAGAHP
ncbi:MlaD family protein [Mycobacterium mantenii]|uniref:Mammalian cell entry protein n=1 Tax=Mycobacterium mantenii TaxID=560555 RepID=A0A1A2TNV5_MYCNT|nr:MCE family protein [Mycobacterium mantenii]OBH44203.1 mammalian cell entry protein [Mycobacterium mantenii]OBH78044.1 mammalian cell entry protein [Mycobacterium mantenii]